MHSNAARSWSGVLPLVVMVFGIASSSAVAVDLVDSEGPRDSGINDLLVTAESVGSLPNGPGFEILGWVDSMNTNDIDFYRFDVGQAGTTVVLDIDYADDGFEDEDIDRGFDSAIWIFDDQGRLIAYNDDSDFFALEIDNEATDPGSDRLGDRDAFIGEFPLSIGRYYAAVGWYGHAAQAEGQTGLTYTAIEPSGTGVIAASANPAIDTKACPVADTAECTGAYLLTIRTQFVPEPGFWPVLLVGILLLAGLKIGLRPDEPGCVGRCRHCRVVASKSSALAV